MSAGKRPIDFTTYCEAVRGERMPRAWAVGCNTDTAMGSLKKRRKAKINKHKRRKKLRAHRHKKRTWQK
jgi:hypothetical protein